MRIQKRTKQCSFEQAEEWAGKIAALFGMDAKPDIRAEDGGGQMGSAVYRVHYEIEDVTGTKRKDAEPGQTWMVKVSGRVVPVRLTRVGHRGPFIPGKGNRRPWFWGVNTRTDRDIEGNRMRLRGRVA